MREGRREEGMNEGDGEREEGGSGKEGVVRREGKGGSGKEGGEVRKVMREKEG